MNNHYFIGKLLNPEDAKKLEGARRFLSKTIPVTGKVYNFNTKFAYLGYFDHNTALIAVNKLSNVFEALSTKFAPLECQYTKYDITGPLKTKKSVSAIYKNGNLTDIIAPYIREEVDRMVQRESEPYIPHISLLRFDAKDENMLYKKGPDDKSVLEKTFLPSPDTFKIDSIDIFKGIPKIQRMGAPSKYDEMDLQLVSKFDLRGTF